MEFEKNVFINCPFDSEYLKLLRPLLFTVIYVGLHPRIALETADGGQARMKKILGLIRDSKYSIHDLSRMESTQAGELYRMNMPFELGIDFGCRQEDLDPGGACPPLQGGPVRSVRLRHRSPWR